MYIYYRAHMHLHLWNDTGLWPHGQIMCSLRNKYQLEYYKMGPQLYSAHTVWYFGHQHQQSFFGSLRIHQKIMLICSDTICGHTWKRMQTSRSKLESTHSPGKAGPTQALQVLTLYRDPSLGWVARAVKKGIINKNLQAINFQCFQFRGAAKRTWQKP